MAPLRRLSVAIFAATVGTLFLGSLFASAMPTNLEERQIFASLGHSALEPRQTSKNSALKFIVASTCCKGCANYNNKEMCCCAATKPVRTRTASKTIWKTRTSKVTSTKTVGCGGRVQPRDVVMAPAEPEVYNIELQSEEEHIPEIMMDEVKWNRLEGRQARHLCPICPTDNSTVSTAKQNTALHGCCPAIYRTVTKSFTRSRTTTVRVWTTTTYCPPAPPPPESSTTTRSVKNLPFKTPTPTVTKTITLTKSKTKSTTTFCASNTDYGALNNAPVSGATGPDWALISGPVFEGIIGGSMVSNATAYANGAADRGKRDVLFPKLVSRAVCPGGPGSGGTCGTLVGSLITNINPGKSITVQITPFQPGFVTHAQLYFSCSKPTGNEPLSSYQVVVNYPRCSTPDSIVLSATSGVPNCGAGGIYLIFGVTNDCMNDKCKLTTQTRVTQTKNLPLPTTTRTDTATATATRSNTPTTFTRSTSSLSATTTKTNSNTQTTLTTETESTLTISETTATTETESSTSATETTSSETETTVTETASSLTTESATETESTSSETATTETETPTTTETMTETTTSETPFGLTIQTPTATTTTALVTATCTAGSAFGWIPGQPYSPAFKIDPNDPNNWAIILGLLNTTDSPFTGFLIEGASAYKNNDTGGCPYPGSGGQCGNVVGTFTLVLTDSGVVVTYNMYPGLGYLTSAHVYYACTQPSGTEPRGSYNLTADGFDSCNGTTVTLDSTALGAPFDTCPGGYYLMIHSSVDCGSCSVTTTKPPFGFTIETKTSTSETTETPSLTATQTLTQTATATATLTATRSSTTVSRTQTSSSLTTATNTRSQTATTSRSQTASTTSRTQTQATLTTSRTRSTSRTATTTRATCTGEDTAFGVLNGTSLYNAFAASSSWGIGLGVLTQSGSPYTGVILAGASAYDDYPNLPEPSPCTAPGNPSGTNGCGTIVGTFTVSVVPSTPYVSVSFSLTSGVVAEIHVNYNGTIITDRGNPGNYPLTSTYSCGATSGTIATADAAPDPALLDPTLSADKPSGVLPTNASYVVIHFKIYTGSFNCCPTGCTCS